MRAAVERWLQGVWWDAARRPPLALRALERLYRHLLARSRHREPPPRPAPRPVLVVGNLIVGGAGKTPTVIALVQALQSRGRRPGVVSRGHGRRGGAVQLVDARSRSDEVGDEPLLIARRTGVPLAVGRDRVAAARRLCQAHPELDLLIADDGLQHHALARQAQLIVFDERGIGNGHLLPAGPLREPMAAMVPPRSVVLYNAGEPTTAWPGARVARGLAGVRDWAGWQAGEPPSPAALQALRGRPLLAVAGIAAPERFFVMLEAAGLQIRRLPLPDHAPLQRLPWTDDDADVVLTEKDAVKLVGRPLGRTRVWVATLDFHLPDGLVDQLLQWLDHPTPHDT
ncbi:tetraacyldisaccharide 4'-kinase [Aquabacterium sp. J223]|uniref:tetraacyldisaccharide 4'-kinase n=1 Tax=Aquabacterium sp. J223 TaxID=2898431 RepID=UPI0021AD6707|nr:tetraacyldisaccharide 4'-kinase [Aquabacterium sp. J223]UUX94679.1 tetraacyldisaccharide 4'-kinase [Aquabacterium sp. J223]